MKKLGLAKFQRAQSAAVAGTALALLATAVTNAAADSPPVPQNVISLSATATVDVPQDWLTVVFGTTREGSDAGVVQGQLKQLLDAALNEARKVAKPGQVEVRTGGFSLQPRYAPINPRAAAAGAPPAISGWQGSTELIVEGRDIQVIAQLTGRIPGLTISRVGYSLSREARQKVEGEVTAQAIEQFRARALTVSRQFGFTGYTVREVSVGSDAGGGPVPMLRMQASRAMADEAALPTEAGKTSVNATVSGSVQMTK
jgi:predicted secreted protein